MCHDCVSGRPITALSSYQIITEDQIRCSNEYSSYVQPEKNDASRMTSPVLPTISFYVCYATILFYIKRLKTFYTFYTF